MRTLIVWLLFLSTLTWAVDAPFEFKDAAEAVRFRALATQLRCLVCQNQTIEDSHAPLAQDLRKEVLRLMREGHTDADIKRHLTQRYGDFVLYQPRVTPSTWLLWFGPALLLLAALALAWRRWRAHHAQPAEEMDDTARTRAWALLAVEDTPAGAAQVSAGPASGRAPGGGRRAKGARP